MYLLSVCIWRIKYYYYYYYYYYRGRQTDRQLLTIYILFAQPAELKM